MTATLDQTIREIVATDFRTAAVFQRYGLDFCCNGGRTVEQGCREAAADAAAVLRDLDAVLAAPADGAPAFASWSAPELVHHIVETHHAFVREAIPALLRHTRKVADVHGDRHPELIHIAGLFERVAEEMADHMVKEEQVLFPFVVALADGKTPSAPFGTVRNPIRMLEAEHQFVGDAMAEMRRLTDGYTLPEDACTTYSVCFQELEAFEADLHIHVHLENNVLFPKAAALEGHLS